MTAGSHFPSGKRVRCAKRTQLPTETTRDAWDVSVHVLNTLKAFSLGLGERFLSIFMNVTILFYLFNSILCYD